MERNYSLPLTFLYHERESIKGRLMEKKYLLILTFLYQRGESNLATKNLKSSVRKRLSKCVNELIIGEYGSYVEVSTLNWFTNKVIVKSNMLHMRAEYWISTKFHRTNIVTIDYRLLQKRYTKLG